MPYHWCKVCHRKLNKARSDARYADKWGSDIKEKYGIDQGQYEIMVAEQKGLCAICGKLPKEKRRLSVDHDHATLRVRGLLCRGCNLMLGLAADNTSILLAAMLYLRKYEKAPMLDDTIITENTWPN